MRPEYLTYNPEGSWREVLEREYEIWAARSSGKGGQRVNKASTQAFLRWNLWDSSLSDEEKLTLWRKIGKRLTKNGDLVLSSQEERSFSRNRERVIEKLHQIINENLVSEKPRIPSKTPQAVKERRLKEKHRISAKKSTRRISIEEW